MFLLRYLSFLALLVNDFTVANETIQERSEADSL